MEPAQAKPLRRRRRWLIVALLLVGLWALVALMPVAPPSSKSDEARMCRDCYLGISNHDDLLKRFPRDQVNVGHESSWRFMIERFVEDVHSMPYELDEGWQSEANRTFRGTSPLHFCAPRSTFTRVLAVKSAASIWQPTSTERLADCPRDLIVFVVVERSPYHWMQPGDVEDAELLEAAADTSSSDAIKVGDALWVCFADGTFWALTTPINAETLRPFLSAESARSVHRDEVLAPFRLYDSSARTK